MIYDIKWIIPKLRNPGKLWNIASSITFAAVGIFSKIFIEWLNKTTVYNKHIINQALDYRPKNRPLITVSNHHSCFDDPGIWGSQRRVRLVCWLPPGPTSIFLPIYLPSILEVYSNDRDEATLDPRYMLKPHKMRWSLAAHDICFTKTWHSYLFMLGKCIPVIRGAGVYQEAMNFCIEKLAVGEWIHVFPEGKVNMLKENMRLKWGVGRLIFESPVPPLVIPICHLGMDKVLPNEVPYRLRIRNKVTINYGDPIDFTELLKELRASKTNEVEARKVITDRIQTELLKLKAVTEELHETT